MNQTLLDYLRAHSIRESSAMRELRLVTEKHNMGFQKVAPETAQLLAFIVKLTGSKHVLELGTYFGYSAMAMAEALPLDGHITTCETREEWVEVAKQHWDAAGLTHKITLRMGRALDTLAELEKQTPRKLFDFIFIDADKKNYPNYYEHALNLLTPNGLIAIDNVLLKGKVADLEYQNPNTVIMRDFNRSLLKDPRIDLTMLPIDDGLTLVRRKQD